MVRSTRRLVAAENGQGGRSTQTNYIVPAKGARSGIGSTGLAKSALSRMAREVEAWRHYEFATNERVRMRGFLSVPFRDANHCRAITG